MTTDLQGLERAARLSLGNFEDQPNTTVRKPIHRQRLAVVLVACGAILLVPLAMLIAG